MRTMHPVLKRGVLTWDRALLPQAALQSRLEILQAMVGDHGDDAWLFYGDVAQHGYVTYASNFLPRTRSALVMVPRVGEPSILAAISSRDVPPAKTLTWLDDIRPFSSVSRAVLTWLEERALTGARLGLVGVAEGMSEADWQQISEGLHGARVTLRTPDVEAMRAGKGDIERAALGRAAAAISAALDTVPSLLRPGTSVRTLTAAVDRVLRRESAEDVRVLVAAGADVGVAMGPPSDRTLNAGDSVMLFVRAQVHRYWAEAARTFVLGPASTPLREMAGRAQEALDAMCRAASPGVPAAGVFRAGDDALANDAWRASARRYGYGGGIGLDAEEAPALVPQETRAIVEHAALALRVIVHDAGIGVAGGGVVVVGHGGARALAEQPVLIEVQY